MRSTSTSSLSSSSSSQQQQPTPLHHVIISTTQTLLTDLAEWIIRHCAVIINLLSLILAYFPPYSSFRSDVKCICRLPQNLVACFFVFVWGGKMSFPNMHLHHHDQEPDFEEEEDGGYFYFESLLLQPQQQQQQQQHVSSRRTARHGGAGFSSNDDEISIDGTFLIPVSRFEIDILLKDQLPEEVLLIKKAMMKSESNNNDTMMSERTKKERKREELSKLPSDAILSELAFLKHQNESFFRRIHRNLRKFCRFFPSEDEFLKKYVSKTKMLKNNKIISVVNSSTQQQIQPTKKSSLFSYVLPNEVHNNKNGMLSSSDCTPLPSPSHLPSSVVATNRFTPSSSATLSLPPSLTSIQQQQNRGVPESRNLKTTTTTNSNNRFSTTLGSNFTPTPISSASNFANGNLSVVIEDSALRLPPQSSSSSSSSLPNVNNSSNTRQQRKFDKDEDHDSGSSPDDDDEGERSKKKHSNNNDDDTDFSNDQEEQKSSENNNKNKPLKRRSSTDSVATTTTAGTPLSKKKYRKQKGTQKSPCAAATPRNDLLVVSETDKNLTSKNNTPSKAQSTVPKPTTTATATTTINNKASSSPLSFDCFPTSPSHVATATSNSASHPLFSMLLGNNNNNSNNNNDHHHPNPSSITTTIEYHRNPLFGYFQVFLNPRERLLLAPEQHFTVLVEEEEEQLNDETATPGYTTTCGFTTTDEGGSCYDDNSAANNSSFGKNTNNSNNVNNNSNNSSSEDFDHHGHGAGSWFSNNNNNKNNNNNQQQQSRRKRRVLRGGVPLTPANTPVSTNVVLNVSSIQQQQQGILPTMIITNNNVGKRIKKSHHHRRSAQSLLTSNNNGNSVMDDLSSSDDTTTGALDAYNQPITPAMKRPRQSRQAKTGIQQQFGSNNKSSFSNNVHHHRHSHHTIGTDSSSSSSLLSAKSPKLAVIKNVFASTADAIGTFFWSLLPSNMTNKSSTSGLSNHPRSTTTTTRLAKRRRRLSPTTTTNTTTNSLITSPTFSSASASASTSSISSSIPSSVPFPKLPRGKITLAIDLDETLMHSREKSIYREASPDWAPQPDFCEVVPDNMSAELYQTWIRPHVGLFLRTVSQWYNVVLFTASQRAYAEIMLARIDGGRHVKRIYSRADCTSTSKSTSLTQPASTNLNNEKHNQTARQSKLPSYVKDLRRLVAAAGGSHQQVGTSSSSSATNHTNNPTDSHLLSRILLLDNYPDVFVQPSNGLSISSFLPIESCEKCDCWNRNGGKSYSQQQQGQKGNAGAVRSQNNQHKHTCAAVTDTALLDLLPILEAISHLGDVRGVLQHRKNTST